MALVQDVRAAMIQAMKDKDQPRRDVLRVALGDMESTETRQGSAVTDEQAQAILRKLIKSNQETIAAKDDPATKAVLLNEIAILESLLPQTMGVEQIVVALSDHADEIRAAGNDGQATGIAMRQLKQSGAVVQGKDVSEAVRIIRSA